MKQVYYLFSIALYSIFLSNTAWAQVAVEGQVKDDSGDPLAGVNILVQGTNSGSTSDSNGEFSITAPNKNSILVFSFIGFETVKFSLNGKSNIVVEMKSSPTDLDQVVVSASRKKEKVLEAPASISVISREEIENNVSLTTSDHLYSTSGVDVSKTGLTSSNVVTRGFNNVFSGAVLTMVDNRVASVPSLRVNSTQMIPGNSNDILSIEVLKGPASAIYGPFSSNGVIHILTKSPLDLDKDSETKVSFGAGQRDLLNTSVRTAGKINNNLGYKISMNYLRGTDWDRDSLDIAQELAAWNDGWIQLSRQGPYGNIMTGDSVAVIKNNEINNWNFDARLDYLINDNTKLILSAGRSNTNGIELTGLGAGEARDWSYSYWQARLLHEDLFIQAYGNESNAGESFMRRSGNLIVDNSQFISYQIQHSTDIGKLAITYGADAYLTRPKTLGTINGNNEYNDNIDEKGVYVQGKYIFNDKIDLIGALRYDNHTFVEGTQMSPRAAMVYKIDQRNTFRLSYNKAFESPSALNYSLDILSGYLPTGIGVRGIGNREGFNFNRDENGNLNTFYSPYSTGQITMNDLSGTNLAWEVFKGGLKAEMVASMSQMFPLPIEEIEEMVDIALIELFPSPLLGLKNSLMVLNLNENASSPFTSVNADAIKDIDPLVNSISTTREIGYKGFLGDRLAATIDIYKTNISDFVGALQVMNPNVFIEGNSAFIALMDPDAIDESADAYDLVLLSLDGTYTEVANGIMEDDIAAGLAQIPYGTVMPEEYSGNDVIMTYANFGDVNINGMDFSATYYFDDKTKILGTYSWVDKNEYETAEGIIVPLNAPAKKASLSVSTKLFDTFDLNIRYRWQDAFPVNSGVYVGEVDDFAITDITLGYNLLEHSRIDLSVQNITDNMHNEFVGAPQIGRLTMLRFSHEF